MGKFMNTIKSVPLNGFEFELNMKYNNESSFYFIIPTSSNVVRFVQIFIHMLPPYLGLIRPKVETPLCLERPHKKEVHQSISRAADEYFIRKPNTCVLFPKPNR